MAEAERVPSAICPLFTGAQLSRPPVAFVAALRVITPNPLPIYVGSDHLEERVDHLIKVLTAVSFYLAAVVEDTAENVPGRLDVEHVGPVLADLTADLAINRAADDVAG